VNPAQEKKNKKTIGLKLISVILAVLLWFYVVNQDILNARNNSIEVDLEYCHLEEGLSVNGPDTVYIKLWGVFQETDNIAASVDLTGLGKGTYKLPVNVETVKGAMFTSVQPDKVEVTLEEIEEHGVPIDFEIKQNPPAGYELLDIITVPEKCIIKGTEDEVKKVTSIVCPVELGNVKGVSSFSGKLLARDCNGEPVSGGIKMIPDTATVYVVVNQKMGSKTVNIKPVVSGKLKEGYRLVQAAVQPDSAIVFGSETRVINIDELKTGEIDITGRRESYNLETELVVPEGVRVYPLRALVYVEINKDE